MTIRKVLFYLIAPLILIIPAFYNGYPLVFSDTGTYIGSGMDLVIPNDRPIMYGLFIRYFSLKSSLWLVIYLQSIFVTYTFWHVVKQAYKDISPRVFLLILAFLTWVTGIGWYGSQIMPDIFTVTGVFSALLLMFKNISKTNKIILTAILILSINMHFSNFLITGLTLITLFAFVNWRYKNGVKNEISLLLPMVIISSSILIGGLTNYSAGRKFEVGQGSHVFLMGKMLDSGVLKSFLDDKCQNNNYVLCTYKDSLPVNSRKLLWSSKSPMYELGGWRGSKQSFNRILIGIAASPKHLFQFVYNSFTSSMSQLFQNDIGSGLISDWYQDPKSPPHVQIARHFPLELNQYNQSRQNKNLWGQKLSFSYLNIIFNSLLVLCSLFLFYIFSTPHLRKTLDVNTKIIIVALIISTVYNAIVVASLANTYDRLQARISWVIILCSILVILSRKMRLDLFKTNEWTNKN